MSPVIIEEQQLLDAPGSRHLSPVLYTLCMYHYVYHVVYRYVWMCVFWTSVDE